MMEAASCTINSSPAWLGPLSVKLSFISFPSCSKASAEGLTTVLETRLELKLNIALVKVEEAFPLG